jgi:diaminopimelate epimerase
VSGVALVKAHAYGNDFLLVRATDLDPLRDRVAFAREVCDRHRGIGADGLMVFDETSTGASARLLNADGSRSEVSGNGVRCLAAWLARERALAVNGQLRIDTEAGPKVLTLLARTPAGSRFRASMGQPAELREELIDVRGTSVACIVLRVGNPQCVVLGHATPDRLQTLAAALAVHPFFPEGTNVELADVEDAHRVRILIWERGVGPTLASGTGACAAAVAAAAFGGASREVDVVSPGGTQHVEWTPDGLWLTGDAEIVATIAWQRSLDAH